MKLFLRSAALLLFVIAISTGCKKDKDETPRSLSGTTWVSHASGNGVTIVETLSFTTPTDYKDVAVATGSVNTTVTATGTYSYDHPNVTFFTSSGATIKGTINGNNLYAPSYDGTTTLTYVKQ